MMNRTFPHPARRTRLALARRHSRPGAGSQGRARKAARQQSPRRRRRRAGKELTPRPSSTYLLKERLAQGQPDTPELRNAIRDELNTRELLVREAKKKGLDKNADVKSQMDLAAQTVLVRAQVTDWMKANPVSEVDCGRNTRRSSRRWATRNTTCVTSWSRRKTRRRRSSRR